MEWTALWVGILLERLKPGVGADAWRHSIRAGVERVLSSSLADRDNHPAWSWALGVIFPAVLVQFILGGWDGWLSWLIQVALVYLVMSWGAYSDALSAQDRDSPTPETDSGRQASPAHRAEVVLHQVMGPLLALLLGQIVGLPWFMLVGYVLTREWQGVVAQPTAERADSIGLWSGMIWHGVDAVATRLALLVMALVGRFDAVFEVWLDSAPRWRESHRALWQRGLGAAMGISPDDQPFEPVDQHFALVIRSVLLLIALNTLLAWL